MISSQEEEREGEEERRRRDEGRGGKRHTHTHGRRALLGKSVVAVATAATVAAVFYS